MEILQIIIPLVIFILLVVPIGKYMYYVSNEEKSCVDGFFDPIDNFIYKICGIERNKGMSWKEYAITLVVVNAVMTFMCYVILRTQSIHFLNPNKIGGMEQSLTFNTVISFITNTNLQDYSGESGVSYLSQMIVMTFCMFTSAATGLCAAIAFMRGITGKKKDFGNFFVDITRFITRILTSFVSYCYINFSVSRSASNTFSKSYCNNNRRKASRYSIRTCSGT